MRAEGVLLAVLALLVAVYSALLVHTARIERGVAPAILREFLLCYAMHAAFVSMMAFLPIPMPLVYLLFYAIQILDQLPGAKDKRWALMLMNVHFLLPAVTHLITVACMALAYRVGLYDMMGSIAHRMSSLLVPTVCEILSAVFVQCRQEDVRFFRAYGGSRELLPIRVFLWFCACFVLADSLLFEFPDLPALYTPLFIVSGNCLLLYLIYSFVKNSYRIFKNMTVEQEHRSLKHQIDTYSSQVHSLRHAAYFDALTGACTRSYADAYLQDALQGRKHFSLVYMDVDNLKEINDQEGHLAGDRYLCSFVCRLQEQLRAEDLLARYGGDEFLAVMPACERAVAERRMRAIRHALQQQGGPGFSFGVASAPDDGQENIRALVECADYRMYVDKQCKQ